MTGVVAVVLFIAAVTLGALLAAANRRANRWQRWAEELEQENDDLRGRLHDVNSRSSVSAHSCGRCGARFGIFGASTGSVEDLAAEEMHRADVDYHEFGLCQVQPVAPTRHLRSLRGEA